MTTARVATYVNDIAREVLEHARDAGDEAIVAACRRIWWGYTLARPVDRADITAVLAMHEALRA